MVQKPDSPKPPEWFQPDPFNDIAWERCVEPAKLQLLFSWGARDALGIDPTAAVAVHRPGTEFIDRMHTNGLPGFRLAVVGPDEIHRAFEDMGEEADVELRHDMVYGYKPNSHLCGAVALSITQYDAPDEKGIYLREKYASSWEQCKHILQRPDGFQILSFSMIASLANYLSKEAAKRYIIAEAQGKVIIPDGPINVPEYGKNIARAVRDTFRRERKVITSTNQTTTKGTIIAS